MLIDRFGGIVGKSISWCLILTTQALAIRVANAGNEFDAAVADATAFASELSSGRSLPTTSSNGDLYVDGQVLMTSKNMTGQQDNDYVPAGTDTYGSDSATLIQGQAAQRNYESHSLSDDNLTSGERAYLMVNNSFSKQTADLDNADSLWEATDQVFSNLAEIAEDFANCEIQTQLVSTGETYHIPKYETCTILPAIEETYYMGHEYNVGVLEHKDGPLNLASCGDGCTKVWVGDTRDSRWHGSCTIYEEEMSLTVIQPDKITSAVLNQAKFDDYHRVFLNGNMVFAGPAPYADQFPPEIGDQCERSTSWNEYPNIDLTSYFTGVIENGVLDFKTRTSVTGSGEGYSSIIVRYNVDDIIYDETWDNSEEDQIEKAKTILSQIEDGYCEGGVTCSDMPSITLDENGCGSLNGVYVCEDYFDENPWEELGISPFCKGVTVTSNCNFNEGEICFTDTEGVETCFDNDTENTNTCEEYENDPECTYFSTTCVEGAEGASGECYVQEDTYDCGHDVSSGNEVEEDVLVCDGEIQCIGNDCYTSDTDTASTDFAESSAYLQILEYAKNNMTCEGVAEESYDEDNPPDQYEPVSSCSEMGAVYNSYLDACLTETQCVYDANNFYVAGEKNGIQVVVNNDVKAENTAITECIPLPSDSDSDTYYTCGSAYQKVATDVYHEVCENDYSAATANTCPDDYHTYKEESGLCEVSPTSECPDTYDYEVIEGTNIWSSEDDYCWYTEENLLRCDTDGYALNSSNVCEMTVTEEYTYYCPDGYTETDDGYCLYTEDHLAKCDSSGYTLNGAEKCEKTVTEEYTYYCDSGYSLTDDGTHCLYSIDANESCPSGYTNTGEICQQTTILNYTLSCADGYTLNGDGSACIYSEDALEKCPSGYTESGTDGVCIKTSVVNYTESCPDGYTKSNDGTQCVYSEDTLVKCPTGYTLSGDDTCSKTTTTDYNYYCPTDYTLINGECVYSEYVGTTSSCPDGFSLNSDGLCQSDAEESYSCDDGGVLVGNTCQYTVLSSTNVCKFQKTKYAVTWLGIAGVLVFQWNGQNLGQMTSTNNDSTATIWFGGYEYKRGEVKGSYNYMGAPAVEGEICRVENTESITTGAAYCSSEVLGTNEFGSVYVATDTGCAQVTESTTTDITCSNSDATYNESTGYCTDVVSAVGYCPDGYTDTGATCTLTSYEDAIFYCASGLTYDDATGLCFDTEDIIESCPSGYTDNGSACVLNQYADTIVYCAADLTYDDATGLCFDSIAVIESCPSGYTDTGSACRLIETEDITYYCTAGYTYDADTQTCYDLVDAYSTCPNDYLDTGTQCSLTTLEDATIYCASDYTYDETTGMCYDIVDLISSCPSGYSDTGTECSLTTYEDAIIYCSGDDLTYDADSGLCFSKVDASSTCPAAYPTYDEDEQRCVSATALDTIVFNSDTGEKVTQGDILDSVLAPFGSLISSIIPAAVADDTTTETVTQESMNAYVADKFETMAENLDETIAMVSVGTAQLYSAMSTESQIASATESQIASTTEGGSQNVTCELFSGEAMECKIAVGGMQNCCKSPIPVSLADYVKLTTTTMHMDALTGQVFGMEGYSGAWAAVKDGVSYVASSAWDSVSGLWTSSSDVVAANVENAAAEQAGDSVVAGLTQSIMSYTNTFLTESFGPDVASMFFTETTNAAGESIVSASPQMAAAGQFLMYCYYAYLAYVVFTLLVNILFACEDEELDLAMKVELLSTHYLGPYCKTKVLGMCIEKRKSYCAFASPFSRIIMEQIYAQPQMGLSWGSAKNPNCTGMAISDLSKVDWDAVDLSEWVAILIDSGVYATTNTIDIESLTGSGSYLDYTSDQSRDNVIESVQSTTEDVDADDVNAEAYDEAWNSLQ